MGSDDPKRDADVPTSDAKDVLTCIERKWAEAVVSRNRESVAKLIDEDFMVVDATGHVWERGDYLDGVASGLGGSSRIRSNSCPSST